MSNRSYILILIAICLQASVSLGNNCSSLFANPIDQTSQFLKELSISQKSYRADLYSRNDLDPQFFKNFARKTDNYYAIDEVLQNYPFPQARESVENVVQRLHYVLEHWSEFKIPDRDQKYFHIDKLQTLLNYGNKILKENKFPFYETMDFIDAGLMYSTGIRSPSEVKGGDADSTYVMIREKAVSLHGKGDPGHMYMLDSNNSGRAFEYLPHPALIVPFLVKDRLFEFREFN